jgi:mannonate dehydratase
MEQTWRWFGPSDKVSLSDARQAGAEGIVSALHFIPVGAKWTRELIEARQNLIRAAGLHWSVVESLDVSERIKLREKGFEEDVDNFIESLRNLAEYGIRIVAYNLMPVFSWMRTDLAIPLASGGFTTGYSAMVFAAFDLYMLGRVGAEQEWGELRSRAAHALHQSFSPSERKTVLWTILQGLPGGNEAFTLEDVRHGLERYRGIDQRAFRDNAAEFLKRVCPIAEELGVRLCVHPDDPPRSLLGLPRIVSTADDLEFLMRQWSGEANGITFCTEGDADLITVVIELVREENRRIAAGDTIGLPFRADHGQQLLNDRERGAQAGYPAIGRLRGLAELRGVMRTTERFLAFDREAV